MANSTEHFARVYNEHVWHVYGFFGYRLSSREECEDLTQQTFEKALRAWSRFDPTRASAKTWLLAIAQNLLIDHFRRNETSRDAVERVGRVAELEHERGSELELPGSGLSPRLAAALESLDDRSRQLIALRFGGDLNGREIARMTGLSLDNVQQILSRSLRKLRAGLEGQPEPDQASSDVAGS